MDRRVWHARRVNLLKERRTPRGLAVVGTAGVIVVGVVLLVLAYCGITFGLGTDKTTVVTTVLTFDALLFGGVAAVVALAAYWEASGRPELSAELLVRFSEKNEPTLLINPPTEQGSVYVSKAPHLAAELVIRNASTYAARNPSVAVKLRGMALRTTSPNWEAVTFASTVGVTELLWDGGADRMIHGLGLRKLPGFTLSEALIIVGVPRDVEVTLFADGTEPRTTVFSVQLVQQDEWGQIMKERSDRAAEAALEEKLKRLRPSPES